MLGIIRVLTTENEKVLGEHGKKMDEFLHIQSETYCIDDQPRGIYDDVSEAIAVPKIVQLAKEMEAMKKYKALTISCAADPALQEVREEVTLPVLGAGSVGAYAAKMVGSKVGIVGITENVPENIQQVLAEKFHSYTFEPSLRDTVSLFSEDSKKKLLTIMQEVEKEGADVILFACTGFSTIQLKKYVETAIHVPVIDLVEAQAIAYQFIK